MNPWIQHVQQYAKKHNMTYFQALRDPKVKEEYKGVSSSKVMPTEKGMGMKKMGGKKLIDFSQIHWGAFTKDWQKMGAEYPTLRAFADAVLKSSKYPPIVIKRARFYKNIILKGKGLGMCA